MPLPLNDEHRDLAASVAAFARRTAPVEATRARFAEYAAGGRPDSWDAMLPLGLHCLHLPEEYGGGGAGLPELAVVAEQLGKALFPGPYLPTVLASAVVASARTDGEAGSGSLEPAGELLTAFSEGATGALVVGRGLSAARSRDGWTVSGTTGPVLGLPGAEIVIVRADVEDSPGESLWFRLAEGPSVAIGADDGTDLTRSVGRLELDAHRVDEERVLRGLVPARVDLTVNALLAAEASGITAWCLDTAVEHAKTRVQFGRPVGAFQAVQHKAAMMLVRSEITCAAAWDAARAADQPTLQQELAAAQAAITALPLAVDTALECVTVLGGIGFTWEHDAHLYWRRAISVASAAGAEERWATRLGEAALKGRRDFSFVGEDDLAELRIQVGNALDEVLALPEEEVTGSGWATSRGGARRARLADAGLVSPHYPPPYGLGAGPAEQAVIGGEFARRGLVQPTTVIGEWVLPTLLVHGTTAQQERFIGATLRGEIVWCQLFSEPGAGSDLAGLSTKARKVPGGWSLSGQKVWNSLAHEADWGVCLARTDSDVPKHQGLSYFLVDMRSAGVEVRPLRQATGLSEFNEVFLDDVFVPDECLVAEPGHGWRLAVTTLSNERLSMGSTKLHHGSADRIRRLLETGGHDAGRQETVRALGRGVAREIALSALNLRSVLARLSNLDVGAEISVLKVYNTLAQREGSRELLRLLGPLGCVVDPDADHVIDHIGLPAVLFGGGTIEIQLNVIAQRVLGLPR
ncbi:acyl-CoA dehydrogenase [Streptosporangium sp. NPDC051023]|uniref:acyl-CoA dehydrogenase n=1 Tax=Streptosporangium sp. NPDC051023 TaxID=3155410 RepID=UPI00344BF386